MKKLAIILAAVAIGAGCTFLNPLGKYDRGGDDTGAGDGATPVADGPSAIDASEDGGCVRALPPPRPASDGPEGEGTIDVINAVRSLDVGAETDAGLMTASSYDQDGVCTCPGASSCTPPDGGSPVCDEDAGGDNAGGELFAKLAQFPGVGADPSITQYIVDGEYGMLLEVSSYNGGADDTSVTVGFFVSNGTEVDDAGARIPPTFDGNDVWTVDPSEVGNAMPPYVAKVFDLDAYVSGGTLVAKVPDGFPMRVGQLTMTLDAAHLTARIVKDAVGYHLEDGRVFGRWPSGALLMSLAVLRDPTITTSPNPGVCGASPVYAAIKNLVCNSDLDITSSPDNDNTGAPCNAISMSVRFTTAMAKLGPIASPTPKDPRDCPVPWVDDCMP